MVDIQSATDKNRRREKKKKERMNEEDTTAVKYNVRIFQAGRP